MSAAARRWRTPALALLALLLAWALLPALDLMISHWAYRENGGGFWLRDTWPAFIVYRGTRFMTAGIVTGLLGLIAYGLSNPAPARRALARRAALALLSMALGSGLIVHQGLKDHLGRPRPAQIEDFGGQGHYVPPGIPSDQCERNCSFTSGHAAAGFALIAGGLVWPRQRRRWLWLGLAAGGFIGAVRIVQGAHFFSDVLGSAAVVLATCGALECWARKRGWLALPKA
ncbi:MAG: phosphatase PAP2 family protein [Nevskia sp.]